MCFIHPAATFSVHCTASCPATGGLQELEELQEHGAEARETPGETPRGSPLLSRVSPVTTTTMACFSYVALLVTLCCSGASAFHRRPRGFHSRSVPDELWSSTEQLVAMRGYECEVHTVRTPDGYELTLHRIPRAKATKAEDDYGRHGTPVLFAHGLASNSEMFALGPSAAYYLVDAGFDVWLVNYRGSFYGQKHVSLKPQSRAFWDFSWNENGLIDQPTFIDYILKTTGRPKLFTVGHSMGATTQVVMMSEMPEYAKEKVISSVLLAPGIYFRKPGGLMRVLDLIYGAYPQLKNSHTSLVLNGKMPLGDQDLLPVCFAGDQLRELCRGPMTMMMGPPHTPDYRTFQKLMAHYPNGGSIRQFMHYLQSTTSGGFRKYDFGPEKNQRLYGSLEPPSYNLSAIATPVHVFYGTGDYLTTPKNVVRFIKRCPTVQKVHAVPHFNHVDFITGDDYIVTELVNKKILEVFQSYL
ncbi:lipase 1-like [Thrips palmi]|uniref:Lipase 1-like n=1 Tax=Thrips palmi TaxID=161013 RepID=A0A6P8ZPU5_THRPL|nr:lipase 1-like [Thrips palmi]